MHQKEKKSEVWVEMDCGLEALIVPTGMVLRMSSVRHECMEYIPGNISQLVHWVENNKNNGLLWGAIEDETYATVLPTGLLLKSESEASESLKFIHMSPEAAREWIGNLVSDKEK